MSQNHDIKGKPRLARLSGTVSEHCSLSISVCGRRPAPVPPGEPGRPVPEWEARSAQGRGSLGEHNVRRSSSSPGPECQCCPEHPEGAYRSNGSSQSSNWWSLPRCSEDQRVQGKVLRHRRQG